MKKLILGAIVPLITFGCGDDHYYEQRDPVACYYSKYKACYGCEYESADAIIFKCRR